MSSYIVLHRLGTHKSDHDLEPSCGVMDIYLEGELTYRFVVDIGAVMYSVEGRPNKLRGPYLDLFSDGKLIDGIFITHAHDDHAALIPALMPYLRDDGDRIYMTKPTEMMVRYNLAFDQNPNNVFSAEKPYRPFQSEQAVQRIFTLKRPGKYSLFPRIDVWVQPAGHMSGACSFTFNVNGTKIHFAGDRCEHDQPSVLGAPPLPENWRPDIVAASDCTYGATLESPVWKSEADRFIELSQSVLKRREKMLVYTFAKSRAGIIGHLLQESKVLRSQNPVCMDGTARDLAEMIDGEHKWCEQDSSFKVDKINMLRNELGRHQVHDGNYSSYIAIAPPGMGGPGGSGTWWRRRLLMDPEATIAFTGYCAPGTDGYKILETAKRRNAGNYIDGIEFMELNSRGAWRLKKYPFHCKVEHFRLGGHNDRKKTIQWFYDMQPKIAVLSHGSTRALAAVESALIGSGIETIRADVTASIKIDL